MSAKPKAKKASGHSIQALHPSVPQEGNLKHAGGSRSDTFNSVIILQTLESLWLAHAKTDEAKSKLYDAAASALVGIALTRRRVPRPTDISPDG